MESWRHRREKQQLGDRVGELWRDHVEGDIRCRNREGTGGNTGPLSLPDLPMESPFGQPSGSQRTREQPTRVREIGEWI